jgi:hypothetical protein
MVGRDAAVGTAVLSPAIVEAMAPVGPKFLATLDAEGVPNIVPITSLQAVDESTIIFGELMIWKTRRNLEVNPRVCIAVMTPTGRGWIIQGDFQEFQRTGPYVDLINSAEFYRYNAYTGIRSAGVIRAQRVVREFALSRGAILLAAARARWAARWRRPMGEGAAMPMPVREKFARLQAAKFVAWLGSDGYPDVAPVLSLTPAGERALVFAGRVEGLERGAPVAAAVLTAEPLAYQVKGRFLQVERSLGGPLGAIQVLEVYSASPPLPGERLV